MLNLVKTDMFNICFPFFQNSFLDHSEAKDKRNRTRIVRVESQNRNFIQATKGVQVKNVLPNNCANNNCLFECLIKWN